MDYPAQVEVNRLTAPFHSQSGCVGWPGAQLPLERLEGLRSAVATVVCWRTVISGRDERLALALDEDRLDRAGEAWLPVITPLGPGVLVHHNCD